MNSILRVAVLVAGVIVAPTTTTALAIEDHDDAADFSTAISDSVAEDCCTVWQPCTTIAVDALFLTRTRAASQAIAFSENGTMGNVADDTPLLDVEDLDFDYEPGVALSLTQRVNDCTAWQAVYFGLQEWSAAGAAVDPDNLQVPFPPNSTFVHINADAAEAQYSSELHNGEFNFVCDGGCQWSWLYGLRYLSLTEDFLLRTTDQTLAPPGPVDLSDYFIATRNRLLGLQVGAVTDQCLTGCLGISLFGKAGVFANMAEESVDFRDIANFGEQNTVVLRNFQKDETDAAFVGELGAALSYQMSCTLAIRGGYRLLWIDSTALAPDQLDFNPADFTNGAATQPLQFNDVLFHGAFVGVEWNH